jgi:phage-related minor tail protein
MLEQGVCHTVALAIYMKEDLKKAKEELWKLKYFTMKKKSSKKASKRNRNPSRY